MQRSDGKTNQGLKRFWARWRVLGGSVLLFLLPLAVWAQEHDEDHKDTPLDPQTKNAQLITFGVVAAIVLAVAIFYYVRRWQLMHSEKVQEGFERDQD